MSDARMDSSPDGDEDEGVPPEEVAPPPPPPPPPPPRPVPAGAGWTGGRIVGVVFTTLGGLIGLMLLLVGLALIALHAFVRDDDGFYTIGDPLESRAWAIVSDQIDLGAGPADPAPSDILGTLRVSAESTSGGPIFVGIARSQDLDRYLRGVGYSEVTEFGDGNPDYNQHFGRAPRTRPATQRFWVAQSQGPGKRQVDWDSESGIWSVAIMNPDAARGVSVNADVGAELNWLIWVAVGFTVVGIVLLTIAVPLIIHISRSATRDAHAAQYSPGGESS